mgnify:CR=1 FL=1
MSLILRQQKTLELVRERGYISIEELAQHFDVTPQTIRRDINQLADEGLLRRYHGGAAHDSSVENTEYTMRVGYMLEEKLRIDDLRNGSTPVHIFIQCIIQEP